MIYFLTWQIIASKRARYCEFETHRWSRVRDLLRFVQSAQRRARLVALGCALYQLVIDVRGSHLFTILMPSGAYCTFCIAKQRSDIHIEDTVGVTTPLVGVRGTFLLPSFGQDFAIVRAIPWHRQSAHMVSIYYCSLVVSMSYYIQ